MDKRMQRAKINAPTTLVLQVVTTISGLLVPWALIDTFGSEVYGATTSISQFLAYIALFEGGVGRVARGALYGPLAMHDEDEISRIYLAVKRFFSVLGVAFLGYALVLAFFYYDIADVTLFTREYTFALVLSMAIGKFAEYMGGISNITLFNADQKQYIVNVVTITSTLLNVIAIVFLCRFGADILWVRFVSSMVFVLKPILFTVYLKTHYRIKKSKVRAVLENRATGIAQHMAYVIQNNTDVLILTVFANLKYVAVYSVYHLVCFSLRSIILSFTGGMEAVFGDMIAKNELDTLRKTYLKYKSTLAILTVVLFGAAAALIVPFVSLYTKDATDANYIQPVFALILLMGEAINCLVWPCFNLPIAANQLKQSQIGAYSEAAINLTLSCVLVWWNPLVGVALGTLASAVFKSVYYIVYSGKHILKVKIGGLLKEFSITVGVLAVIGVAGMLVVSLFSLRNYFVWILAGFCTVIGTAIVAFCLGMFLYPEMTKEFALSVIDRMRKIFGVPTEKDKND